MTRSFSGPGADGVSGFDGRQRPTKIVFVIGSLDVGGTERQLVALARGLDRQRFAPVVVCLSGLGTLAVELADAHVPVRVARLRGRKAWKHPLATTRQLIALWREIRAEKPVIIHGLLFHAYVFGSIFSELSRTPVCVASRRSLGQFKESHRMVRLVERLVNRYTDLIVANSEAVRQDAIRQEGLPPDKVVVIHNGLDAPRFAVKPRADLRAGLGVRDGVPVIGVVANFIHYKGHEFFLEAWRRIRTRTPDAVGLLVGDGPMRAPMERRAAEMGLADSLRFVGLRNDIPDLLALMDVVVHPSLEEGFSNAVLEAMAAGRALVVTAVGGNPEAVTDEVTGVLVPPRDPAALAGAVLRLLADPAARVRLGDAARRRVASDFTLDAMVRQYEALYQRLIDRSSSRSAPSGANTPPRKERQAPR